MGGVCFHLLSSRSAASATNNVWVSKWFLWWCWKIDMDQSCPERNCFGAAAGQITPGDIWCRSLKKGSGPSWIFLGLSPIGNLKFIRRPDFLFVNLFYCLFCWSWQLSCCHVFLISLSSFGFWTFEENVFVYLACSLGCYRICGYLVLCWYGFPLPTYFFPCQLKHGWLFFGTQWKLAFGPGLRDLQRELHWHLSCSVSFQKTRDLGRFGCNGTLLSLFLIF